MLNKILALKSLFWPQRVLAGESHAETLAVRVPVHIPPDDEEVPRYPPFMMGIPLKSPESILSPHQSLINNIRDLAALSPEEFDLYYLEALRRFASFVHLLPASQAHHHRGAGGMLRHGLEVALWTMQGAENVLVGGSRIPRDRRDLQPRWRFAVFVSGLCHDLGKAVTDLSVIDRESDLKWNSGGPLTLFEWGEKHGVYHYVITWNEGRHKMHESVNSIVLPKVLTFNMIGWMSEIQTDLPMWIAQSVSYSPGPGNPIFDLVLKADRISVERDAKELGLSFSAANYDLGVPVEKMLCDVMRELLREGVWTVNSVGSRLWVLDGCVYVIWPAGGEDVVARISRDKLPGLPRSPESLSDFMLERGLIAENAEGGVAKYFRIAPDALLEKLPNVRFPAIQLTSCSMIFDVAPESVKGIIVGKNDADYVPAKSSEEEPVTVKLPLEHVDVAIASSSPTVVPLPPPTPPIQNASSSPPPKPSTTSQHPKPAVENVRKMEIVTAKTEGDLEKHPLLHQVLQAIVRDLDSGKRVWGNDAVLLGTGDLCIRWPEGFSGYGIEPKLFLTDMFDAGWLSIEMATPFLRCFDTVMKPGAPPVKAARITPSVVKALRVKVKKFDKATTPITPTSAVTDEVKVETQNPRHATNIISQVQIDITEKAEVLADTIGSSPATTLEEKFVDKQPSSNEYDSLKIAIESVISGKVSHSIDNGFYVVQQKDFNGWLKKERRLGQINRAIILQGMRTFDVIKDGEPDSYRFPIPITQKD